MALEAYNVFMPVNASMDLKPENQSSFRMLHEFYTAGELFDCKVISEKTQSTIPKLSGWYNSSEDRSSASLTDFETKDYSFQYGLEVSEVKPSSTIGT